MLKINCEQIKSDSPVCLHLSSFPPCSAARLRHVINDWPISSSVADLKQHIYELSLDTISPHFALAILGKRIDLEETKSLEEVGAMDGDILTIEPNRE